MRRLRTFLQQPDHLRVDGERRSKSRSWHSVLSARATLLGLVKVNVVQHFRILPTVASGLRAQHSSCQPKVKWDGQKASSCEQPVDVARAGDGAPIASTSCRKTTLEPGRPSQPTLFSARSSLSCRSIGLRDETSYFCRDLSILLEPGRSDPIFSSPRSARRVGRSDPTDSKSLKMETTPGYRSVGYANYTF